MNIFAKLFGKKKTNEEKREEKLTEEKATTNKIDEQEASNITLDDVEKELKEMSVAHDAEQTPPQPAPRTDLEAEPEVDERIEKEIEVKEKKDAAKAQKEDTKYAIKKHDKGWQIIADGADRAHRVFPTQKEAIDFAKDNNLTYDLYRADGTLRK